VRLKPLLSAWKPCGLDTSPPTSRVYPTYMPLARDLSPGVPRRIGAVETAPQRMEALRAGRFTPNERIGAVETAPQRMEALRAEHLTPTSESVRLKPLLSAWKPCGLNTSPPTRRIGAVETAPQRMEALRAGHLTLNEANRCG
jgi:hypothetical protein